jgi:hypothetical protein
VSAGDAKGGDRIEVAQLLRGEAVAGTVPASHVEAQGQDGYRRGASVRHVEVAGFHAIRDDLADDLADFTLLGRDVRQVVSGECAGLVQDDMGDLAVVGVPDGEDSD